MSQVVVTGLGFISSIGNDRNSVLESLQRLRSGIELYPPFDDPMVPVHVMGTIKGFDTESIEQEDWTFPSDYRVNRAFLRSLSPHALYGYCALTQAIAQAGLDEAGVSNEDTGLFTASAGSTSFLVHHVNYLNQNGVERSQPKAIVASIAGTLNFNLASHFHIKGATCGYVSACASSGHALGAAFEEIVSGRQKRMLVVGAEDGNRECILPFAAMRALSVNPDPAAASRPFDKARDGFVGTGGGVAMVLEDGETARARGARILARFTGYGQASDGYNAVLPQAQGDGVRRSMLLALKRANRKPEEVDYVNAHAPSTQMGDIAEVRALNAVFPDASPAISSTKGLTGHALSMASILEAGICVLSLDAGIIPGSVNIAELEDEAAALDIARETRDQAPAVVMSNSSGFGGANVTLIFERGEA